MTLVLGGSVTLGPECWDNLGAGSGCLGNLVTLEPGFGWLKRLLGESIGTWVVQGALG